MDADNSVVKTLVYDRCGYSPTGKTITWDALTGLGKTRMILDTFCSEVLKKKIETPIFYACDTIELALEFILNMFSKMEQAGMRCNNIKRSLDSKLYCLFELNGIKQCELIAAMKKKYPSNRYTRAAWNYIETFSCYASFCETSNSFQTARMMAFKKSKLLITTHESLKNKGDLISTVFKQGFIDEVPNWTLDVTCTRTADGTFINDVLNFKHDHKAGKELRALASGLKSGMIVAEEVLDTSKKESTNGWIVTRFNYQKHPFDLIVIATAFPTLTPLAELGLHGGDPLLILRDCGNQELAKVYSAKNKLSVFGINASKNAIATKHVEKLAEDIDEFAGGDKTLVIATAKVEAMLVTRLKTNGCVFLRTNCRGLNSYSSVEKVYIASDVNMEPAVRRYYVQRFGEEKTREIEQSRSAGANCQSMMRGSIRTREDQNTRAASPSFRYNYQRVMTSYTTQEKTKEENIHE